MAVLHDYADANVLVTSLSDSPDDPTNTHGSWVEGTAPGKPETAFDDDAIPAGCGSQNQRISARNLSLTRSPASPSGVCCRSAESTK